MKITSGSTVRIVGHGAVVRATATAGKTPGASDYEKLANKPRINSVELRGDRSLGELGMSPCDPDDITNML